MSPFCAKSIRSHSQGTVFFQQNAEVMCDPAGSTAALKHSNEAFLSLLARVKTGRQAAAPLAPSSFD